MRISDWSSDVCSSDLVKTVRPASAAASDFHWPPVDAELCSAITGRSRASEVLAASGCWMVSMALLLARAAASGSLCRAAGVADRFDVALVGAAAAAQHRDVAEPGAQVAVLADELGGIAVGHRPARVERLIAEPRGHVAPSAEQ